MQRSILIVGTSVMSLYHHRLELIKTLISKDYKVLVAAPRGGEEKDLEQLGCKFIHTPVDTRGTSIKKDLQLLRKIFKIYREEKPDIVLTFYTKTNIYGGLLARLLKIPYVENITGLGTTFSGSSQMAKLMSILYKEAVKNSRLVFFQNKSNKDFFIKEKLYKGKYVMLPGSGVSLERYACMEYPKSDNTEFLFVSRIIKEKGIEEYLFAAEKLKAKYPESIFHVAGPCDSKYEIMIKQAQDDGTIIYHGKIYDIQEVLKDVHCTVLPSYYPEGMANVLLESAASGRPVITTSLPGCGETVEDGVTGFIVPEKDGHALAETMERFINTDNEIKKKMGKAGRKKMEKEFNRKIVTDEYLKIIKDTIG